MKPHSPDLNEIWGTEVVESNYAGHPGLMYRPSPKTIPELLIGTQRWVGRDYLVQGDRRITHDQFHRAIGHAASHLAGRGVGPGDRVVIFSYNNPEFVLATWAIWWLGAVPVYANRWWSPSEILHGLETAQPTLILADTTSVGYGEIPAEPIEELSSKFEAAGESGLPAYENLDQDAPALVLFTSGSSGAPKGVLLSQRSVIANQHNLLSRASRLPQSIDPAAAQPAVMVSTPLFHIGGVSNILTNLISGGKLALGVGRFDPAAVLMTIEKERIQTWGGVPTMASRVLEHPDFTKRDLSSLRSFPLGGAPVSQALLSRLADRIPQLKGRGLVNTWGMTESGGFVTVAGSADLERFPGTVGRPYPCSQLRINDPDEKGNGEILLRSPTVMLGYIGIDDGTLDSDGWLHTGDLGHINDDGYLFLTGRSKDIVIRGGENVACAHVEGALMSHPSVVEAAVTGMPDEDLGEVLVAGVRFRPGQPVTADDLRRHCVGSLAHFEIPDRWYITSYPLPTLAGEKVDKTALRSLLEGQL